jgi:hypothetical protein
MASTGWNERCEERKIVKAERIEIRPASWKMVLAVIGIVGFVIVGIAVLVRCDSILERAVGVLVIVFFGGFGGYSMYLRSKGQGKIAILPAGLEVGIPGIRSRIVPWADIEDIGTTRIAAEEFTTVRLRSYQAFLSGIAPEEARSAIRFFRGLRLVGCAVTAVGIARQDDVGDLAGVLKGSEEVRSLASMLVYCRRKFGAEFLLGWNMRDRGAQAFAEYLEDLRRKYTRTDVDPSGI